MTLTKQWLQHQISAIESVGITDSNTLEAFKMALAGMESEPVADVVAWSHPTEERTCDIRWRRHDVSPGPLYTAPQPLTTSEREELENYRNAQQVVPGEQHSERFDWTYGDWAEHLGGRHQNNDPANYYEFGSFMAVAEMLRQFGNVQRKAGWNACRAAMLQGKSDGALTNEDTRNHPEDNLEMVDHSGDANEKGNSLVIPEELLSAMEEVLRISDRDHDAWHRAKNAIKAFRER